MDTRRLWALLSKRGENVNVKRVTVCTEKLILAAGRLKRKWLNGAAAVNAMLIAPNSGMALDFRY